MSDNKKSTPQSDLVNLEYALDAAVKAGALTKMQVCAATQSLVNLNEFINNPSSVVKTPVDGLLQKKADD